MYNRRLLHSISKLRGAVTFLAIAGAQVAFAQQPATGCGAPYKERAEACIRSGDVKCAVSNYKSLRSVCYRDKSRPGASELDAMISRLEAFARVWKKGSKLYAEKSGKIFEIDALGNELKEMSAQPDKTEPDRKKPRRAYAVVGDMSGGYSFVSRDGKYGFVDARMTEIIAPKFENAGNFSEGLAPVKMGGKWGYINSSGSIRIPCIFDAAWPFSNGSARVRTRDQYCYIDKAGKVMRTARGQYQDPGISGNFSVPNVYHDYGNSNRLRPESIFALDSLVSFLTTHPTASVEIYSYCDNLEGNGNPSAELKISQERAQMIIDYLDRNGIDKIRITARGFGSKNPAASFQSNGHDLPEGRQLNRRTEFRIISDVPTRKVWYNSALPGTMNQQSVPTDQQNSNRSRFHRSEQILGVMGRVLDRTTQEPMPKTMVKMVDQNGSVSQLYSPEGYFSFRLQRGKEYIITGEKSGYTSTRASVNTMEVTPTDPNDTVFVTIYLK